jgi:L-aspartate oxidase
VTARPHSTPDLLVAGAGLAGLYAALLAAADGASVMLVTKGSLRASNSFYAQGGIAAAVGDDDSPELHLEDTLAVGRGLCDPQAVRVLVNDAPGRIADLERLGVGFDRDGSGRLALGREGGHGRRRILHAGGSATGAAIAETLIERVREQPRIRVVEHAAVIGLLADGDVCGGAWVLGHDELRAVPAAMTLIATGGACALYARTTNPPGALGDGIALAARSGAAIRDMEFVQFHPTALAVGDRAFLISEAVRGEGAHLVDQDGRRFMPDVHDDAELAPRDLVAREIQRRLTAGETSYLTLAHLEAGSVRERFPNLVDGAAAAGLDLTRDRLPVAPAAHYLMGGITTDLDGAASLRGLYASGECASSGVHGANRLASNSLLECFVFSRRAVAAGLGGPAEPLDAPPPERAMARVPLAELRRRMWHQAGPVRDEEGLTALLDWLADRSDSNPVAVARLIAAAARARHESRGAHVRSDHPAENPSLTHHLCPQPSTA